MSEEGQESCSGVMISKDDDDKLTLVEDTLDFIRSFLFITSFLFSTLSY